MIVESSVGFGVEALQPNSPPLTTSFRGDDSGVAFVATQMSEVNLVKDLDRESFIRQYPPLAYFELDEQATSIDELYRETRSPSYKRPIAIPIYVVPQPPKRLLKRFGLEVEQEAVGLVSIGWLERYQPSLQMKTGDRLGYYDQMYTGAAPRPHGLPDQVVVHEAEARNPNFSFEVLEDLHCDYFGNTQIPLHLCLTLKNLRAPGKPDTDVNPR